MLRLFSECVPIQQEAQGKPLHRCSATWQAAFPSGKFSTAGTVPMQALLEASRDKVQKATTEQDELKSTRTKLRCVS